MSGDPLSERALRIDEGTDIQAENRLLRDVTDERFYSELGLSMDEVNRLLGRTPGSLPIYDSASGKIVYYLPSDREVIDNHKELIGLYYSLQHIATDSDQGRHELALVHEHIDRLWVYYESAGAVGLNEFENVGDYIIEGQDADFGVYGSRGYEWMLLAGLVCYVIKGRIEALQEQQQTQQIIGQLYLRMPPAWVADGAASTDYRYRDWVSGVERNWDAFVHSFMSEDRVIMVPQSDPSGAMMEGPGGEMPQFINNIGELEGELAGYSDPVVIRLHGGGGYLPKPIEHYANQPDARALYQDVQRETKVLFRFHNEDLPSIGTDGMPKWMTIGNDSLFKELGAPEYQ